MNKKFFFYILLTLGKSRFWKIFADFVWVRIMGHFCRPGASQDHSPFFVGLVWVKNFDKIPLVKTICLNMYY